MVDAMREVIGRWEFQLLDGPELCLREGFVSVAPIIPAGTKRRSRMRGPPKMLRILAPPRPAYAAPPASLTATPPTAP